MERILVSACLMGQRVRYDGGAKTSAHPAFERWRRERRLVSFCPEVSGGLPVPRPPAEIETGATSRDVLAGAARIVTDAGADATDHFLAGARGALAAARRHGIRVAILKEGSPSCGVHRVGDGTFSGAKRPGDGVTARLLADHGIRVFTEAEIDAAAAYMRELERGY
ncbi:DUF523 domain-containing protein [Marinitenerispora sediminis]|uniref:DUF523 domain-containing protein n=1 Tax=Marinitenerispora sediminis TaxID=1931232 RepID=A0A368TBA5_9ACTN|nr:DUF523 domain-containing protein [Marinitenerispora sediminis]RCV54701.1 DUF523 domain-containing protein [Marinitenerispora sediminis]RCV59452.1 DUF523 domain-containing protein [Marinitenerispora sediminis]RCV60389.1 DUF523 domain-containing protein [Marinitenerispora sediminis]